MSLLAPPYIMDENLFEACIATRLCSSGEHRVTPRLNWQNSGAL